jgi:hypothetical protein
MVNTYSGAISVRMTDSADSLFRRIVSKMSPSTGKIDSYTRYDDYTEQSGNTTCDCVQNDPVYLYVNANTQNFETR